MCQNTNKSWPCCQQLLETCIKRSYLIFPWFFIHSARQGKKNSVNSHLNVWKHKSILGPYINANNPNLIEILKKMEGKRYVGFITTKTQLQRNTELGKSVSARASIIKFSNHFSTANSHHLSNNMLNLYSIFFPSIIGRLKVHPKKEKENTQTYERQKQL